MLTFIIITIVSLALIAFAIKALSTTTPEQLPKEWSFGPLSKDDCNEMIAALNDALKMLNQHIADVKKQSEVSVLAQEIQIMCINRSILTVKVLKELAVRGLGYRLQKASHILGCFNRRSYQMVDSMKKADGFSANWRAAEFNRAIGLKTDLECLIARIDEVEKAIRNGDIVIDCDWNVFSNFNGKTLEKLNQ